MDVFLCFRCAVGRVPVAVGAGAAMAAVTALIDASGSKLTGQTLPDGQTAGRKIFPYES